MILYFVIMVGFFVYNIDEEPGEKPTMSMREARITLFNSTHTHSKPNRRKGKTKVIFRYFTALSKCNQVL